MTEAGETEHELSDGPAPMEGQPDLGMKPALVRTDKASGRIKAGVALFAVLSIAIGIGGGVSIFATCVWFDCSPRDYIFFPIGAVLVAVLVIVAGRAALAGNRIGLVVVGLAGLASIAFAIELGRLAVEYSSWLAATAVLVTSWMGVMLLAGAAGQNQGTALPRRLALLGSLAVVIFGSVFFWVLEGGRSICPAVLPSGLPAGLTWTTDDNDVCISTETGASRRIYRLSGADEITEVMWSPDGATLAVNKLDSHEFVSTSGEVRDGVELAPQWYADRPIGYCVDCPVLSPNRRLVAVYRMNYGFGTYGLYMGSSESGADLVFISGRASHLSWSSDGEWLAFDQPPQGPSERGRIFVVRSDGTSLTEVADRASSPAWRP